MPLNQEKRPIRRYPPKVEKGVKRATDNYLKYQLRAIENRLGAVYAVDYPQNSVKRLAAAMTCSDPTSPVWNDILQAAYWENARSGLLSTMQSLPQQHRRNR